MSRKTPEIKLVIFDCDGVLVDSEPLATRVLLETLAEQGLAISEQEVYRNFLGRSLSAVRKILQDDYALNLGEGSLQRMRSALFALFRKELQATDGCFDMLEALSPETQICVASSSAPERIRRSLEITGLLPYFNGRLFSATEVENGKPAPDLFLHVANSFQIAPENCLVVEDSVAGITAARAAGMRVVAYTGGTHFAVPGVREGLGKLLPYASINDMRRLPAIVNTTRSDSPVDSDEKLLMAVDVGTGSVRVGIVTASGNVLARAESPLDVFRSGGDRGAYSSQQIWSTICTAVQDVLAIAGVEGEQISAIGFDATCSLVVLDENGNPLPVTDDTKPELDTIAWFDHRALEEAKECTDSGHDILQYFGGVVSPEMEVPKLMWLKRHLPETWDRVGYLFDLADFLTWKATGSLERSQPVLTAKWAYLSHQDDGWDHNFFETMGISDVFQRGRIPKTAAPIGSEMGALLPEIADALNLTTKCKVAAGMIDAHAGALGVLGKFATEPEALHRHLGLIAGTSSCLIALSVEPRPAPGVWGPYYGAVLPGIWLNEAGQSATGALLDHIIRWHSSGGEPTREMHSRLVTRIKELRATDGPEFARRLHVLPDFHGNRSPLAEPDAVGVISGLTMDTSFDGLCRLYWRTAVGIALGLRHILETLNEKGYGIDTLHVTGGHTKNPLLLDLYADATGCDVVTSEHDDAVLIGTAMIAATAAGIYPDLASAGSAMVGAFNAHVPDKAMHADYENDYQIFLQMHRDRQKLDDMNSHQAH